jgi:hypothetical protein
MEVARSFPAINASHFNATAGRKLNLSESTKIEKWESTENRQKCKKEGNWNRRTAEGKYGSMHYV